MKYLRVYDVEESCKRRKSTGIIESNVLPLIEYMMMNCVAPDMRLILAMLISLTVGSMYLVPVQAGVVASVSQPDSLSVEIRNADSPVIYAAAALPANSYPECTPWVLTCNNRSRYYITTGWSYAAFLKPGKSFLTDVDALETDKAYKVSVSNTSEEDRPLPELLNPITYWRRNYYGVFTSHVLKHPKTGEPCVVYILHGENKNEKVYPDIQYPNTVMPNQSYSSEQFSGYGADGRTYHDYWDAYSAFISMAYCPLTDTEGNRGMGYDQGPILWPSGGYLDDKGKLSGAGLRHPSSIVSDGYIYVYYNDCSKPSKDPGRQPGTKVARAPIAGMGLPGTFQCYYNGSFSEPALPEGFNKFDRRFFYQSGGRSSSIFPEWGERFSVARIEGTPYFLGVEERHMKEGGDFALFLRVSTDLVHWSKGTEIPRTRLPWTKGMHYPILANKEFTDNTTVNPNGFYVVGSTLEGHVSKNGNQHIAAKYLSVEIH